MARRGSTDWARIKIYATAICVLSLWLRNNNCLAVRAQRGDMTLVMVRRKRYAVKNPNGGQEIVHRSPQEIMHEIASLDAESAVVLHNIRGMLCN